MTLNSSTLWKMILDYYPDGVDVQAVGQKTVIETTMEFPVVEDIDEDTDPMAFFFNRMRPQVIETHITLTELEPETGIYTAMSEKTHRVYVFVDVEEHGVI